MPISITDLEKDRATCTVEWEEETAEVVFRPSGYTPLVEDRWRRAIEGNRPIGGLAEMLASILIEWELVDENGAALPPTRETLEGLPSRFLVRVMDAINEANSPGREDRKNSAGGSQRAGRSGGSLSGTR